MRHIEKIIAASAFAGAAVLALGGATLAVNVIENSSRSAIAERLVEAGLTWAEVQTDGLQVTLSGTAMTEAMRFRALSVAGGVVDSARVIDNIRIADPEGVEPPRFSMELLRNDDGVSLIGLVPMSFGRNPVLDRIDRLTGGADIADMLDSSDHPIPRGWHDAVEFGLYAMGLLPRSKISIAADRVVITAISDSREQQRSLSAELAARVPEGLTVSIDISAPRPVITPFTLRFVIDAERGARFDACAADTEAARDRILAAGREAGAPPRSSCTIGLGVPSPSWGDATASGIAALARLGEGSITFSDADVSLIIPHTVTEEAFDQAVGSLDRALPDVFSLEAVRLDPPVDENEGSEEIAEFIATLDGEGQVLLRGRLTDERTSEAVQGFARARFGMEAVEMATRLEPGLPEGWPLRVLTGLEALSELHEGTVRVRADSIAIRGRTGDQETSGMVSRILSEKLGRGQVFNIDVTYDEELDPVASLPSPESCIEDIELILEDRQITFEPGSAQIDSAANQTLDAIAGVLRDCGELPIEISGHTDSQGRAEMNLNLSQRRADSVREALLVRRVLTGQFVTRGYGDSRPIADNSTAAGRELNRRIEFRLIDPEHADLTPGIRPRDPELEATLEITVELADDDVLRPAERPNDD
ncbi:OmpA family protein [Alkalilacustris brevis]|uniref:OmpA family protein n=1 Tax=Alkalilacustris brevis TaxID=2026338 RepID=UPI000E0E0475|nr:OmpA family protein [Alkalilacustris brevis]